MTRLRDLVVAAVGGLRESKPVGPDDHPVLQDDSAAQLAILPNDAVGMDEGVVAHAHPGIERGVGQDPYAPAQAAAGLDDHVRADVAVRADGCVRRHDSRRMDKRPLGKRLLVEQLLDQRKGVVRKPGADGGSLHSWKIFGHNEGRCSGTGHDLLVLSVRHEGDLSGAGPFDALNGMDLRLAVAGIRAIHPRGNVFDFHTVTPGGSRRPPHAPLAPTPARCGQIWWHLPSYGIIIPYECQVKCLSKQELSSQDPLPARPPPPRRRRADCPAASPSRP